MKRICFIIQIIAGIIVCSCANSNNGTNGNARAKETKDTLYNDNIQSVFFGTPFGASKDVVIKNFTEHGFAVDKGVSTDVLIHFAPINGSMFCFGNMTWQMVDVGFKNNQFNYIRFLNARNDKASAIHEYDDVLANVSKKYHMTEEIPKDTTVYKVSVGYGKSNRFVWTSCYRSESVSRRIFQYISLEYEDENISNGINEEL